MKKLVFLLVGLFALSVVTKADNVKAVSNRPVAYSCSNIYHYLF